MVKTKKKPQKIYTLLALRVTDYRATVSAGISYKATDKRYFYQDPKVYSFDSAVEIDCCCYYPEDRADASYNVYIGGHELFEGEFSTTLDYYHIKREDGSRKYRTVRGQQVPQYQVPSGIGFVDKVRGENCWTAVAYVSPGSLSDMLTLLVGVRPLYVTIHEVRENRRRSIADLTVQTGDPVEE